MPQFDNSKSQEERATGTLPPLVSQLSRLTQGQPTNAEIKEAIRISQSITRGLFEWHAYRTSEEASLEAAYNAASPAQKAAWGAQLSASAAEHERINRAKPDPFFQPASAFDAAIAMVRPPNLAEGA